MGEGRRGPWGGGGGRSSSRGELTRKRHIPPHSAQPQHTNYWAPRTRKRHQQEHRPQRPTESSDPTQRAKGRTGDRPGPRKGATTRRNVTQGEGVSPPYGRVYASEDGPFPVVCARPCVWGGCARGSVHVHSAKGIRAAVPGVAGGDWSLGMGADVGLCLRPPPQVLLEILPLHQSNNSSPKAASRRQCTCTPTHRDTRTLTHAHAHMHGSRTCTVRIALPAAATNTGGGEKASAQKSPPPPEVGMHKPPDSLLPDLPNRKIVHMYLAQPEYFLFVLTPSQKEFKMPHPPIFLFSERKCTWALFFHQAYSIRTDCTSVVARTKYLSRAFFWFSRNNAPKTRLLCGPTAPDGSVHQDIKILL